jgi:general secretion pathway protein K
MRFKRTRQRGVAVITALLLTTLAVTIVASLFWQQQVQVRSMENQRLHLQTKWILRGALDWARLVLRQDGIDNSQATTLDAVWNTPLAETRLDQYIERERVQGEVFDASLSGRIMDATARYNLLNLAEGRAPDKLNVRIFARLLNNLQIDPALAEKAALAVASSAPAEVPQGDGSGVPQAQVQQQPGSLPTEMTRVDDLLSVPGFTPAMVEKLRPFVIVLPSKTPVNVNTAPAEVLAALVKDYSVSQAAALVARRKTASFRTLEGFKEQLYGGDLDTEEPAPQVKTADITSTYFLVQSRIRLDRAALDAEALVQRQLNAQYATNVLWIRQN